MMTESEGRPVKPTAEAAREDMRAVLDTADCLYDEVQVRAAYDALGQRISAIYAPLDPLVLLVMTGGFVAGAEVLRRLRFPLQLDYLHATRYRDRTQGADVVWKHRPEKDLRGRHVLVIDDILDEGGTLADVRRSLTREQPASLRIAVLADKRHDRRVAGARAEFVGLELPDRYVFGCGMDYKGYWRQLPAIYAVKGL